MDDQTIGAVFTIAVAEHGPSPFLVVPVNAERSYLPSGLEITYTEAGGRVAELIATYREGGYGLGHRVATLLENHPDYVLHKLALNAIGACCVPINPDYRPGETAYLIDHREPDLVLTLGIRKAQITEALSQCLHRPAVALSDEFSSSLRPAPRSAGKGGPTPDSPSSILYTSGSTGRPKGCILSHGYEVASGERYASLGGLATLRSRQDRIYNALPLYHANSGVLSLFCAILTGNCQIQPDRFHPHRWWPEIVATRATVVHYLGIIAVMLYNQAVTNDETAHHVRFGIGAASHVPKIMQWWAELYQDEKQPMSVRIAASDRLVDRALGRPTQAIENPEEGKVQRTLIVRWMPPDPNDRSKVIEPEPD
jgi:acyl-CoA synthetase (AMP-forming)/AMP-acid ligase II